MRNQSIILILCTLLCCPIARAAELSGIVCGSWIEISAHPFHDFHFVEWHDGNTEAVRQIQVNEDATYIAYFAANCEDYANWPVVALYDWLLMVNVKEINALGYYFTEKDVTWYRVVGEPDDMQDIFPMDDIVMARGSNYLTIDRSLQGTGNYYAVVDVSNSQGMLCDGLMRSIIVYYSGSDEAATVALLPNAVPRGQQMKLVGLHPFEQTDIYVYSTSGQLIERFSTIGSESIYMDAHHEAGCYQVVVKSESVMQTVRYIVTNK